MGVRAWVAGMAASATLAVGVLSGCGSPAPPPPAGSVRVPVRVDRRDGIVIGAYVRVEVRGRPFTFLVDTGSGVTFVASDLIPRLGVRDLGAPVQAKTIGCSVTTRPATLGDWSLGGHPLPTETVGTQALTNAGREVYGAPYAGQLGAGTLATFGVIELDTRHGELTLGGALRAGGAHQAPLRVVRKGAEVVPLVSVDIEGRRADWVVDTGSTISFADQASGQAADLHRLTIRPITVHSPSCTSTVHLVRSGPWMLGGVPLPQIDLASGPSHLARPITGLLGEDVISHFGSVTVDFAHQRVAYGD